MTWRSVGTTSLVGIEVQPAAARRAAPTARRARRRRRRGAARPAAGVGDQVAAHVAGGEAERAQAGDLHVREVLADAAAGRAAPRRPASRRRSRPGRRRTRSWMRCIRSRAASASGRPGGNDGSANARAAADGATRGDGSAISSAARASASGARAHPVARRLPGPAVARAAAARAMSTTKRRR